MHTICWSIICCLIAGAMYCDSKQYYEILANSLALSDFGCVKCGQQFPDVDSIVCTCRSSLCRCYVV